MKKAINVVGSSNNTLKDREELDFYQTPSYAINTLLKYFDLGTNNVWEPMAGNGAISKYLIEHNLVTYSSDIIERDFQLDKKIDYFNTVESDNPFNSDNFAIITNPPYKFTDDFIIHTLTIIKPKTLCVFLPIRYLEGKARYAKIYNRFRPSNIFVYAKRLGAYTTEDLVNGKVTELGVGSAIAYSWMCFRRNEWNNKYLKTIIDWIAD